MRVQWRVYTTTYDWKFSQQYQDEPVGAEWNLKEYSFTLAAVDLYPHGNVNRIGPGNDPDVASYYGRTHNVVHNCVSVWICIKNLKTNLKGRKVMLAERKISFK